MKPLVSVIIPAKNEEAFVGQSLDSLTHQTYPKDRLEVIVVDNNSTDNTADEAKKRGAKVVSLESGLVGAVRNFGASNANGEILIFIDADCTVDCEWIERGVQLATRSPETTFGGGCLLRPGANWLEKNWLLGEGSKRVPKDLIGASIVIPKPVFQAIGGFEESISSGEDTALTNSLRSHGYKVEMTPDLSVVHLGNATKVLDFFQRQIWHSENYWKNLRGSIQDLTFLLICFYTLLSFYFLFEILKLDFSKAPFLILGLLAIPAAFSAKRILRSKEYNISPCRYLKIYFIDNLYVWGRMYGLLKGLAGHLFITERAN